jgi:hypothetical protein
VSASVRSGELQTAGAPAVSRSPRGVRAGIFGVGAAGADRVVTNPELEARLDTSEDWIARRTGIRERRRPAGGQSLSSSGRRRHDLRSGTPAAAPRTSTTSSFRRSPRTD